jgi:hypothetical protein
MTKIRDLPIVLQKLAIRNKETHERLKGFKVGFPKDVHGSFIWGNSPEGHKFWSTIERMSWSYAKEEDNLKRLRYEFPWIDLGSTAAIPVTSKIYLLHKPKFITIKQND